MSNSSSRFLFVNLTPIIVLKWCLGILFIELLALLNVYLFNVSFTTRPELIEIVFGIFFIIMFLVTIFFWFAVLNAEVSNPSESFSIKRKSSLINLFLSNLLLFSLLIGFYLINYSLIGFENCTFLIIMTISLLLVVIFGRKANLIFWAFYSFFLSTRKTSSVSNK